MIMSGVFFYNKKGPCRSGIDDRVLIDPHEVNGVKTDLVLGLKMIRFSLSDKLLGKL